MSSAVAVRPIASAPTVAGFTSHQVALIKDTVARDQNLTDAEFAVFLHVAQHSGLDPLARQIYAIRRKGKLTIQTAIDGYRLIAARTGEHVGTDDAVFLYGADREPPVRASVTVYRWVQGQRFAFTASAWWAEYEPEKGQDFMWRKMPHGQLAKVAEALALRKAFPSELAGLYVADEMDRARSEEAEFTVAAPPPQPARQQRSPAPQQARSEDPDDPQIDALKDELRAVAKLSGTTVPKLMKELKIPADASEIDGAEYVAIMFALKAKRSAAEEDIRREEAEERSALQKEGAGA